MSAAGADQGYTGYQNVVKVMRLGAPSIEISFTEPQISVQAALEMAEIDDTNGYQVRVNNQTVDVVNEDVQVTNGTLIVLVPQVNGG